MAYSFKHGDRPLEGMTIQRAVGRGGFGEVYYTLSDSGKQLALKYLRDNADVELRGIAHVMNLKSPHLITIYDVRRSQSGDPFVIMEYVGGPSLRELMNAEPSGMGVRKATFFLTGIAKGLSHLHERGIVHRDLKPGNIFYDDGYVKIGDYGLSKHISVSRHSANTVSVGTVHYMAPEIGSGSYSKAIDIYALGVILYEMLTGRLPYTGSSMAEILMRHLNDRPNLTGVPEPFARVIARALAKDPAARYPDVNEMVDDIMSADGLSTELASFDPSSLSLATRDPEAHDPLRTMTTPPRRPRQPDLDVRQLEPRLGRSAGSAMGDDIPDIPPLPDESAASAAEPRRRHAGLMTITIGRRVITLGDATERVRRQYRRIREGLESLNPAPRAQDRALARATARADRRARLASLVAMVVVVIAVSLAMALFSIRGDGEQLALGAIALVMMFIGATAGALLAHFAILRHVVSRHPLVDRIVYAGVAFLCMAPALAPSSEAVRPDHVQVSASITDDGMSVSKTRRRGPGPKAPHGQFWPIIFAPMAAMVLCDWDRRIRDGRANKIEFKQTIWPAVCGYMTAEIMEVRSGFVMDAAVLAGLSSLFTQYAASLWPIRSPATVLHEGERPEPSPREELDSAVFESERRRIEADAAELDRQAPRESGKKPEPELVIEAQPSFVGRTADAGLSFVGKVLILAGLGFAVFFAGGPFSLQDSSGDGFTVENRTVTILDDGDRGFHLSAQPVAMVIGGAILMVLARRRSGAAHFLRGLLGTLGVFATVVLVTGRGSGGLHDLIAKHTAPSPGDARLLCAAGLVLLTALTLIFWPRRRSPRTIVI